MSTYGSGKLVHELFAQQAKEQAEAVAVEQGEEKLSYGELNRRSNQLAQYYRRNAE